MRRGKQRKLMDELREMTDEELYRLRATMRDKEREFVEWELGIRKIEGLKEGEKQE